MATHSQKARALRDEYEAITGFQPKYPRSRVALQDLRGRLDRYTTAQANVKATGAQNKGTKDFVDEFARLGQIDKKRKIDDFDLDRLTSAGELEGEPAKFLKRAKTQHRREGASKVFASWRQESPDPYDLGDVNVNDDIRVHAGNIIQDNTMSASRAAQIIGALRSGEFIIKVKFLREQGPDIWVVEDKFDPVHTERNRGHAIVEISKATQPGLLVGIDSIYYKNAYPVTAVVYGLYPLRAPDPANLAPMRDGDLNCVAKRTMEHFEGALRGQGLTAIRRQKIEAWEANVNETGATIQDVSGLERILKRSIIVRDIAGADIYNSGKYQRGGNGIRGKVELILHNGHAWGSDLHFPMAREVTIYEGDVWQAIREATEAEPKAVWVLGSGHKKLTVDQFVLEDGRTYRTRKAHERLTQACRNLAPEDPEALAARVFGVNHAASVVAKERNDWRPTPSHLLEEIQQACVEHGHGGLWNSMDYTTNDVISIDMKSCYPASFQGEGEARSYFERFGHPCHRMTRVAINGPLPENIGTGFARIRSWKFAQDCHTVIPAWFGKHFEDKGWAPTQLLSYLCETGLLVALEVTDAIVSYKQQKNVWLPKGRDMACSIIGKFTQGSKAGGKRLTRRLITDEGELDFLVRDTRQSGTLVGAPERCPVGWILTYYDGSQPQYTHLRASMLAYAHINLLEMLRRFTPKEAVRVATDSIYLKKTALHKLDGISAFVAPRPCTCGDEHCPNCLLEIDVFPPVAPAQWRDKGETIYAPAKHADYCFTAASSKDIPDSTAPSHADPLARHALSYLNGGGGSGKTTRAIELFRARRPLVFTPTHRLAKEMRSEASRPRPTTASSDGVDRRTGCRKRWDKNSSRVSSYGMRSVPFLGQCSRPSSIGSTPGVFKLFAAGIRDNHHL